MTKVLDLKSKKFCRLVVIIKPIKAFLDEGITDLVVINALDNLQPLWAEDNRRKNSLG